MEKLHLKKGDFIKLLIPNHVKDKLPEFKKGYLEGIYDEQGYLLENNTGISYDIYAILNLINSPYLLEMQDSLPKGHSEVSDKLKFEGFSYRNIYKYPLKIVSSDLDVTYEEFVHTFESEIDVFALN